MKLIASVIWTVCVRPAPWSGRSDAIRKSASFGPLIALHDDAGSAVRFPPPPPEAAVVVSPPPLLDSSSPPHPAATSDSAAAAASAAMVRRLTVGIPPTRLSWVGREYPRSGRLGANGVRRGYDRRGPKWRNWQTRRTQNPVPERACGFDSHLRHGVHRNERPNGVATQKARMSGPSARSALPSAFAAGSAPELELARQRNRVRRRSDRVDDLAVAAGSGEDP